MIRSAPISLAANYPFTATLCAASLLVALGGLMQVGNDPFVLDSRAFWAQPWRMLTTILPHGSPAHLIFNLFWTWTLGVAVEHLFGKQLWVLVVVLSSIASSTAQFAFSGSPIGLSGAVYGLFAFIWVFSIRSPRHRGLIDNLTVKVFIAWFFICIVLGHFKLMNIANIAHGVGALMGALVAMSITAKHPKLNLAAAGASAVLAASILLASVGRAIVNPGAIAQDHSTAGIKKFANADYDGATAEFRRALVLQPADFGAHVGIVSSLAAGGDWPQAAAALEAWSLTIPESDAKTSEVWLEYAAAVGFGASAVDHPDIGLRLGEAMVAKAPENANGWRLIGESFERLKNYASAALAYEKAAALLPSDASIVEALERVKTITPPEVN